MREHLPAELERVYPGATEIAQFLDPFQDDSMEPVNFPALLTTLQPGRSPELELEVFHTQKGEIPVMIEHRTQEPDNSDARVYAARIQRAIVRVLNKLYEENVVYDDIQFMEITDIQTDFLAGGHNFIGSGVFFNVLAREII
jgi:hypothetical protein